ncbi:hypothetical protein GCM10009616_34880 [Microlunatus lacustris]
MKRTPSSGLCVLKGVVDSSLHFDRTGWGAIMTAPLFGPASVQLVFVDPSADLRRTLRRVAWRAFHSWAVAVPVFYAALVIPLPGSAWRRLLYASAAFTVVFLATHWLGRFSRPGPWLTVKFHLTTRRSFSGAASEATFVVPSGLPGFTAALDRAAGIHSAGFFSDAGWEEVRRYIWSYLERSTSFDELVGLGYVAQEINRVCDAHLDQTSVYAAPTRHNKPISPR